MTVERGARLFKGRVGWLDPVVGNFWPSCRLFSIALPHCNVLQIIWTCVRGLTHWEKPPQYYFLKKVLCQKHISDAGTVGGCTPDWSSAHSLPLAGAIILPSMPPMQSIQLNPPPPLISWINIRFASPVSLTYCWYPCWKLPDKRTCDAASCTGSTFQAVGHPWPPSSSLVDNSLLPPHWRKLHSLPHISHCWKVEPPHPQHHHHNLLFSSIVLMTILPTMMITRDARGAYRYLRLLINVWFYEKLDLTVPQVIIIITIMTKISMMKVISENPLSSYMLL